MRLPHMRALVTLASIVFSTINARLVLADTYSLYSLASSAGSVDNIGLTDSGSVTLQFNAVPHYSVFTPPSTFVNYATAPQLPYDNGHACMPTITGFSGITQATCNGGYTAFEDNTLRAFYVQGPGQAAQLLYAGSVTNVLLNRFGDIAFVGVTIQTDTNYLAYDVTSHITPEPSSLLLLSSGAGLLACFRRRLGLA